MRARRRRPREQSWGHRARHHVGRHAECSHAQSNWRGIVDRVVCTGREHERLCVLMKHGRRVLCRGVGHAGGHEHGAWVMVVRFAETGHRVRRRRGRERGQRGSREGVAVAALCAVRMLMARDVRGGLSRTTGSTNRHVAGGCRRLRRGAGGAATSARTGGFECHVGVVRVVTACRGELRHGGVQRVQEAGRGVYSGLVVTRKRRVGAVLCHVGVAAWGPAAGMGVS